MNVSHDEAVEFAKISQRENRVYVGNLSYDVRYKDLQEFMRGGGLLLPLLLSFSMSLDFLVGIEGNVMESVLCWTGLVLSKR